MVPSGRQNVSSAGFPNPHLLGVCCPDSFLGSQNSPLQHLPVPATRMSNPYFSHAGSFSPDQICCSFCRGRTRAALLPFTSTSAAMAREL